MPIIKISYKELGTSIIKTRKQNFDWEKIEEQEFGERVQGFFGK